MSHLNLYTWAFNRNKLAQSITRVTAKHNSDPTFLVSEENIKSDYLAHKGLLVEEQQKLANRRVPKVSSKSGKISVQEK